MNKQILNIIDRSMKNHNTKNGLFLDKYISYYNMKIVENYILYESFCGQGIIDNPYALFREFMRRQDFSDYVHIWVIDDYDEKWFQIMEYSKLANVRYVKYGSDDYLKYISISKYLINNCTFPTYFTKKKEQIYINTWHGETIKHLGFDVPNSRMSMGNTIRNFLSADYILSPNERMTEVFKKSYMLDGIYNGTIIEEGQPRIELKTTRRKYVIEKLRSFGIEIDANKKIVLYAPTWSGTLSNPNKDNYKEIERCIDKNKYQFLYKPHHVLYKKTKECIPSAMDTNELLSICDVLITDYSSIAFDFMNDNKPVIFYVPDMDEYKKVQGLYFYWDFNIAYDIDTLKVYLHHTDELQLHHIEYKVCCKTILNRIFDNKSCNEIKCKNNKIKLLFYIGDFKPNGVTTSFMSLMNFIDYDKYDVSVIVLNKTDKNYIKTINSINKKVRVLCRCGTYSQTLMEECSKDITISLGIGTKKLKEMMPIEMYKREYDRCFGITQFDKLINFTGYSPFYSMFFMCVDGAEKIVWLHNDMIADRDRAVGTKKPLYKTLESVFTTYPYYDKLISASEEIMKINIKNLSHVSDPCKHFYAHNTIDYNRILRLSKRNNGIEVNTNKINFVNNARLSYAKNQKELILAFNDFAAANNNCELYIIGDGELKGELISICGDHVHLVGYQDNPFWIMSKCDCFVFPSLYEGQGIALMEARTLGLPIIVSDLPKMKGIFIKDYQYNIHGFSREDIKKGLQAFIDGKVVNGKFDYMNYSLEAYKEFDKALCE